MPADLNVQTSDERCRLEPLVDQRPHHCEEQRHQQRRGTAFPGDVADSDHDSPIVERQDVEEVAADGICRTALPDGLDAGRREETARQHRLLDIARDLQIVLQRESVRDLEQHEEIHQQERGEQRVRSLAEQRARNAHVHAKRQRGESDDADASKEIHEADKRKHQRNRVHQAPRGRQLHGERHEHSARVRQEAFVPRQMFQRVGIESAREEPVRVPRISREEPLYVVGGEILRVSLEEGLQARSLRGTRGLRRPFASSRSAGAQGFS